MFDDVLASDAIPYSPAGMKRLGLDPAPSPASLHRWRLKGRFGITCQTFLRGGRRFTTPEMMAEFFAAVTAAADAGANPQTTRSAKQRTAAIQTAASELEAEGA